ncbi:hypothetical protein BS50DRAFT_658424 [Corynespora cassiicola Philippines]|uniref:F-box domain-containing protein n=1 Tax=Corynespora cassiicola Philippines TaxID=1448308 RepID=A0A2T2P4I2_CORCC|nr:hypothetical protein BS50DRAFT_658424 [Corynespora cassiicola Philippines]
MAPRRDKKLGVTSGSSDKTKTEKSDKTGAKLRKYPEPESRTKFLELPGEIRNLIYQQSIEEDVVRLRRLPSRRSYSPGPIYCQDVDPTNLISSQFGGLSLTCKQIRSEYFAIYLTKTTFEVGFKDLNTFLQDFFPHPYEDMEGNLQVCIDCVHGYVYWEDRVDLLPLLQLLSHCPNLNCSFVAHYFEHKNRIPSLNKLLRRGEATFLEFLSSNEAERISMVEVIFWNVSIKIGIDPRLPQGWEEEHIFSLNYWPNSLSGLRTIGLADAEQRDKFDIKIRRRSQRQDKRARVWRVLFRENIIIAKVHYLD